MQVRVDDGAVEAARTITTLLVDPGQRILVIPFPPCDASSLLSSVVGHYIDH